MLIFEQIPPVEVTDVSLADTATARLSIKPGFDSRDQFLAGQIMGEIIAANCASDDVELPAAIVEHLAESLSASSMVYHGMCAGVKHV